MSAKNPGLLGLIFCLSSLVYQLSGCSLSSEKTPRTLSEIKASGKLIVLTRNAPTVRYIDRDGQHTGPEHDLVSDFAQSLEVRVEFIEMDALSEIILALGKGRGDIAAAGLTVTPQRQSQFAFSVPYQNVQQQVVCHRDNKQPKKIADMIGLTLSVPADSSYVTTLQTLKNNKTPDLHWRELADTDTEELLRLVWIKKIDCTLADSNIVAINRRTMPELTTSLTLTGNQPLGWMLSDRQPQLLNAIDEWVTDYRKKGKLAQWHDRYYGFFDSFDFVDMRALNQRIKERFEPYRPQFELAAKKYNLPLSLLAAQAYQESHWAPHAKSSTGVKGMMMLTTQTAKALGVKDRLDPKQSIDGGARYLVKMQHSFEKAMTPEDKTWLALAAYNIGRAHMHDAQALARKKGLNPNSWLDIKTVLPLLAQRKFYTSLKYGYARGYEPVRYVQRIREYQHVLEARGIH